MLMGLEVVRFSGPLETVKSSLNFHFKVKNQITLDKMRLALIIGSPHNEYRLGTTLRQGAEGLRANVETDDFQAKWSSF